MGPLVCWTSPLLFWWFVGNLNLNFATPRHDTLENIFVIFSIVCALTYFPFSSAICGIFAAYFLHESVSETRGSLTGQLGFWIRNMFLLPFCLHPVLLCCCAWLLIPIHVLIFDRAFSRALPFFRSGKHLEFFDKWQKPQ